MDFVHDRFIVFGTNPLFRQTCFMSGMHFIKRRYFVDLQLIGAAESDEFDMVVNEIRIVFRKSPKVVRA